MSINDTTMNPFFKLKYCFNAPVYAVASAGWLNLNLLNFFDRRYTIWIVKNYQIGKFVILFVVRQFGVSVLHTVHYIFYAL